MLKQVKKDDLLPKWSYWFVKYNPLVFCCGKDSTDVQFTTDVCL